jgi:hypothetical protein
MSKKWTAEQIPDQTGRTAVVTGANSGLGLSTARELARAGAHVVLACRNLEKGEAALQEVGSGAELEQLDLASLESVKAFAERFLASHDGLDLLINNAGLMAPPRGVTADGFELQFGTNVLGHFALTGRLLGALEGSVAAHPGYSATNLQSAAAPAVDRAIMAVTNRLIAQSEDMGALPTLYAATYPGLEGGTYVGPDGLMEQRGHPEPVTPTKSARDEEAAGRLWEVCEELTGVHYEFPARAASGS